MASTSKNFQCQECGKKMTLRSAERALSKGCTGCGGVDIDVCDPTPARHPDPETAYEMRAAFGEGETVVNVITGQRWTT